MSDSYLRIIPVDTYHVPATERHANAIEHVERLLPDAEECTVQVYDAVQFIDQGENIEAVVCPTCAGRLRIDFLSADDPGVQWLDALDERVKQETLETIVMTMPCCGSSVRLFDLKFDWPAGFARFELSILNPNISEELPASQLAELETILGCKLTQVWAHY